MAFPIAPASQNHPMTELTDLEEIEEEDLESPDADNTQPIISDSETQQ